MSKPSRRAFWQYRFDSFIARGGSSIFISLTVVFIALMILCTVLRWTILAIDPGAAAPDAQGFWRGIYIIFLALTDPGNMNQDVASHPAYKFSIILAGLGGVVILSALIAFITTALDQKLDQLRRGHSHVIEEDHTLILGWNTRVVEILRELIMANESEDNPCVVILAEKDKQAMDDHLAVHLKDRQNTRIVTRSGNESSLANLDIASVNTCKSVIVLGSCTETAPDKEKTVSDTRVIKTLLGVTATRGDDRTIDIVAELFDERNRAIAESISDEIVTLSGLEILAKILVQTSRSIGLSVVYGEIMSFDGCEMYFYNATWGQHTYGEIQFHFPDGVPIGIRKSDGTIQINPGAQTPMGDGDEVLIIAEDDSTIDFRPKSVATGKAGELPGGRVQQKVEKELILGWNPKGPIIIREYGDYVLEGSHIDVMVREPSDELRAQITALNSSSENLTVALIDDDPMTDDALVRADPFSYDNILVLSQDGGHGDPEATDSETIVILLLLRNIFDQAGPQTKTTKLISEVLDTRNYELVARAGVHDFIVSNRLVSMLLAQISEEADIHRVYDDLFEEDGSEIYLKPAKMYFSNFPVTVTFADMMAIAQKREEVCIGVKIKANERNLHKNFGVKLIPEKNATYTLGEEDSLIVVSEDET